MMGSSEKLSYASALRRHLIKHSGEKPNKCNQCDYMHPPAQAIWGHIWKHTVEKAKQMQPVWLCILLWKCFEETFDKTQWRKAKQMQSMWLCIIRCRQFVGTFETHIVEKSNTNAANVILHPLMRASWGHIWKCKVMKIQTNATNVIMHPPVQATWGDIWKKHSGEKPHKCNQCDYASSYASALRRNW